MYISLLSPLSVRECISRLEEVERKETVSLSLEFTPPKCRVRGKTFTLRKNNFKHVPYMHGELSEIPEGTLVTYSMQIDSINKSFNSLWLTFALPMTSCFVLAIMLDSFQKGFSWNSLFALMAVIAIPSVFHFQRKFGEKKSESDKKEMLALLQKILEAKPRMP